MHTRTPRPPALTRAEVEAKCPTPAPRPPHDDRGVVVHNTNQSARMYRMPSYDALALRSKKADSARRRRQRQAADRSYTTGRVANQPAGRWA